MFHCDPRQRGETVPLAPRGYMEAGAPGATLDEKRLRALIPRETQLWHEPEYMVQFGPAAEMIVRAAAPEVDMIVLGVKRPAALTKHLGEGVAYKVACNAPCPVLSVGARYHV